MEAEGRAVVSSDIAEARGKRVWLSPATSDENSFVDQFSDALVRRGYRIDNFSWGIGGRAFPDVLILHWPDEFFMDRGWWKNLKAVVKGEMLRKLRRRGTKIFWVAHNLKPHDSAQPKPWLTRLFIGTLDGVLHLSHYSARIVAKTYAMDGIKSFVIAHGHYRAVLALPITSAPPPGDMVRLGFFGQIRRYKGVEDLVRQFATLETSDSLSVTGRCTDESLRSELKTAASKGSINLDVRTDLIEQFELERAIDAADAVILPYRNILNSGSVFLALSRNRPVIIPNTGSFPELLEQVGPDWVYLYDDPLDGEALTAALAWVRSRRGGSEPDLSYYDWDRIGTRIGQAIA